MTRPRLGILSRPLILTLVLSLGSIGIVVPAAGQEGTSGLESVYATGGIFQDRNGDGFIDFVETGLVLGVDRSASDLAAAMDIAARLGFETMAMDIPVSRDVPESGIGILIGAGGVARAGVTVPGLAELAAGHGMVTRLSAAGREWVVIAGSDDAGTRAAAAAFAGRLPHVGEAKGATLADLIEDLGAYLGETGITFESISVPTVHTAAASEGTFAAVEAVVHLGAGGDLAGARAALEAVLGARAAAEEMEGEHDDEAEDDDEGEDEDGDDRDELLSYSGAEMLRVHLQGAAGTMALVEIPRVAPEPATRPIAGRPGSGGKDDLDLSSLFHPDGLLGDSDGNEIPDRVDAVLSAVGDGTDGAIDLAARLGLESAGITLPMGRAPETIDSASSEPTLVVIGAGHPLTQDLIEDGKLSGERVAALAAGEGLIEIVPGAFGDKRAVVVTGGDAAGVARALEQIAQKFPNLSERGKDRSTVDEVELAVWRFLAQRSAGGQAAAALYKLDRMVEELAGKDIDSANVTVSLEKIEPGIEGLIRSRMAGLGIGDLQVQMDNRDVQEAAVISEERFDIPSEVDAFWTLFRERVLPAADRGLGIQVEARLSEPPEVRTRIAAEARDLLVEAGADAATTNVIVLSAFKQGFSWMREAILPELSKLQAEAAGIGGIRVNFAETGAPAEWPQAAMYSKVRWLKEMWPIDEVVTGALGLDPELMDFEMAPIDAPTYEVIVTGTDGSELMRRTFEPKYVLRPHYDRFADYEMVRVTTGWINATVSGRRTLVDERIITEIEQFWDHYQAQTLPSIYDYVMDRHDGVPRSSDAPYFGELTVEVSLSEPDYMLGIDNEYISSLDSLHEEVYFPTLFFFRMMGRMARGDELTSIGRVIPIMRPKSDGTAGWASIKFTGFATSRPAIVIDYTEAGGQEGQLRRDIPLVDIERPTALAATVVAGQDGVDQLDLRVKVQFENDDRSSLFESADEYQIDTSIMTAAQATGMIANLGVLRAEGLYRDELAFHGLRTIRLAAGWDWDIDRATQSVATLTANGTPLPYPTPQELLPEGDYTYAGEELVQWDTPIPPPEGHAILARMGTFPEATIYRVGQSYLGKDIWAMDLMPPMEASHWSHYKATTFKPTVIYSAREHANEVSSTSHVLKFAETLLTDEDFKKRLLDVNVIVHPFTNPDGAQLAYDLYRITPDFILHAGYLASLGMGPTTGGNDPNPIYPEARVRPKLWSTWLPDIFLNPHGYPSHEVVQLFSEYAGLVRQGRMTERNWSVNRGWFIPGFSYLDDPDYPRHKDAAFQIRGYITRFINEAANVRALNDRTYDRFRRYGGDFEPIIYRQGLTDGVNIQMPMTGGRAGGGRFGGGYNPKVTIWSGNTEAPDETAHGDWMKLVATAGLQWDKAILEYLYEGKHVVDRNGASFWGGAVRLWHDRPRPPKTEESEEAEEGPSGGR